METPNKESINNDKSENNPFNYRGDDINNDNSIYELVFNIISNINISEKKKTKKLR